MSQTIQNTDTSTFIPSSYSTENSSYSSISTSYPVTNGYADNTSTSYAYITCRTGSRATTYISYIFDVSSIPQNATIDSVACAAKVRVSSTSYISTATLQLYNDATAKGSSTSARTTTATSYNLTPGTWTRTELNNIQIRYTGTRGTNNNTSAAYLYFYGALLTVTYTVNQIQYTVTATSSVTGTTVSPATQDVMEQEDAFVNITCPNLANVVITDNGTDVTAQLERVAASTTETITNTATAFTTGFSGGTSMAFYTASSTQANNFQYAVEHTAENPGSTSSGTGSWTYVKNNNSSTSETGYADYEFDFSEIPVNAQIDSVEVRCYGAVENSSQTTSHSDITLFSGTTQKGTMQKFTSASNSIITISDPGTWTRAELQDAKLRFAVGYYGGHLFGISFEVTYTVMNSANDYTYTIENIHDDHVILIEEPGVYIPPEEDIAYTYESITISSINATTNPGTGTTRVITGSNQTITIVPSDPQLTLALDNGVDITSQLQGGIPHNTYTVTTMAAGASYGFELDSSTGYYVSTNAGVAKSASVARLNLNFESSCLVTLEYINSAEANYDYGMFGKLDTTVATDGLTASSSSSSPSDSTSNYQLAMATDGYQVQTISYTVPAGSHYIDIKFGKDDGANSNNDSLQWKVSSIEATGTASNAYTYTLTNITQKHSLIFIFGDVTYYFIESTGTNARLFPDGQQVLLPGNIYKLYIVPDHLTDTVTITDNNIDVTAQLVREDGVDKNDNPVVSYSYTLINVQAAHTINVTSTAVVTNSNLHFKSNGEWLNVAQVWRKIDNRWEMVATSILNDLTNFKKGTTRALRTVKLLPSTYALSNTSYLSISDASNMYNLVENDTYATITHSRASTSYSYYLYLRGFDFSQIPANAEIDSFVVRFKARATGNSTSTSYRPYLINNTTTITGTAAVTTTTATVTEFTGVTATWDTIKGYSNNFGIRFTLRRAASGTASVLYVYGAELDVNYYVDL